MGYRNDCEPHHHVERTIDKTTTPGTFYIVNGQEARLAFPCWYNEVEPPMYAWHHCRDLHDHVGWPSPDHPDSSCQESDYVWPRHFNCKHATHRHDIGSHYACNDKCSYDHHDFCSNYLNLDCLVPVHLLEEGYKDVIVQVDDKATGLSADGWIDEKEDWVIRVLFKAMMPDLEKPFVTKLAVRTSSEQLRKIDTVFLGKLVVLPSAMNTLPTI